MPQLKVVTVMFADLCGSTKLISGTAPEEAEARLIPPIVLMCDAVRDVGGTVSQIKGDGVIALFGAPISQEDHALRACLAAYDIQQRIRVYSATSQPSNVRIGIDSGEVFVGTARQSLSQYYRADGDTVHVASRLEALAEPGTTLITDTTRRLAGPGVEVSLLGWRKLRGLDASSVSESNIVARAPSERRDHLGRRKLFKLVASRQHSAAEPLAKRRTLAPLVGRDELLQVIRAEVSDCLHGRVRVVGVEGRAGMGKTRILATIADELPGQGVRVLVVAPRAYSENLAYSLTGVLLRSLISSSPPTGTVSEEGDVESLMSAWPTEWQRYRQAISDVFGRGDHDASWRALTPAQKHRQIVDAVVWSVDREVERGPVAILIDDLHLADLVSLKLLSQVVPRLRKKSILVLSTFRPFDARIISESWFTKKSIEPMTTEHMTTLAKTLLGNHVSVEAPLNLVVERALGNPFFLEQLVVNLVDEGSLIGKPGAYRCYRALDSLTIPASIAGVVSALVDRLPVSTKETLEAAAILGDPIPVDLLAAMRGIASEEASRQLLQAMAAGLLQFEGEEAASSFFFRHALIREVVASPLPQTRRRALHKTAFLVMQLKVGTLPDFGAALATHALRGGLWEEAAVYAVKTMTRAIARFANRDALSMFELGLEAVSQGKGRAAALVRAELTLRTKVLGAMMTLGQLAEVAENLELARELARELDDPQSEAASALQLATICWTNGEYRKGLEAAESAAVVAAASGKRNLQLAALQARMLLSHGRGRYAEAARDAREALSEFVPELSMPQMLPGWVINPRCNALIFLADCLWRMNEIESGQATLEEAFAILAERDHIFTRLLADFVQGEMWVAVGKPADAVQWLESALFRCQQHDVPTMHPAILAFYCIALAQSGRAPVALETLSRAYEEEVHKAGGRYNDYFFPRGISICHLELGSPQDALEWAQVARAAAEQFDQGGNVADAMLLEGRSFLALGRRDEALTCIRGALAQANVCAMHLTASHAQLLLERVAATSAVTPSRAERIL